MSQPTTNTNAPLEWEEIKRSVLNYQAHLKNSQPDAQLRRKAFVLDKDIIEKLLQANGGNVNAIRLYIGSEPDGTGLRLFPVACQEKIDAAGNKYFEDINIPQTLPDKSFAQSPTQTATTDATSSILPDTCETRPCPPDCSTANFLNTL